MRVKDIRSLVRRVLFSCKRIIGGHLWVEISFQVLGMNKSQWGVLTIHCAHLLEDILSQVHLKIIFCCI